MKILTATGGIARTNCHLLVDEGSGECLLIDAPDHTAGRLLDVVEENGWKLSALWLTHGHFDHLADHAVVSGRFPKAHLVIHELEVGKLERPGSAMFQLPFVIPPGKATATIADGDRGTVGGMEALAMHTPGHSPGHVCFYFEREGVLVGGDLIIGGAVGRTDLPDASIRDLQASIQKVMKLPGETKLLPGHGAPSTLAEEARNNPYVRMALAGRLADMG
jgi:hydroxyacylglutathione hydrolase